MVIIILVIVMMIINWRALHKNILSVLGKIINCLKKTEDLLAWSPKIYTTSRNNNNNNIYDSVLVYSNTTCMQLAESGFWKMKYITFFQILVLTSANSFLHSFPSNACLLLAPSSFRKDLVVCIIYFHN